jgi:deoxyguanosine kinase
VFVSIEGCMGSGKSTTAKIVAGRLSYSAILEDTGRHPFLAEFYSNPTTYALETELGFVLLHYHQLRLVRSGAMLVADFSPGKDLVFARMNLEGQDLTLFEHVYGELASRLVKPQVAVFLDLPVPLLMERIWARARPFEQGIAPSYVQRLRDTYFQHFPTIAQQVIVVNVGPTDTREEVAEKAFQKVKDKVDAAAK